MYTKSSKSNKADLVPVLDKLQGKIFPMNPKRAIYLATKYSSRFVLEGVHTMPKLPQATKALDNGMHTLIAMEVETRNGDYGPQEEITCLVEGSATGEMTRVWVSHKSLKKIEAAAKVGLVTVHEDTGEWEVNIGARFCAFVAAGKIVGFAPAKGDAPAPKSREEDNSIPF